MSTYVCAFIEYHLDGCWHLFDVAVWADREPPYNFAPSSWGEFNFSIYYQQSAEKGLPDDLSVGLGEIIEAQLSKFNDEVLNRPSWMSLQELLQFFNDDESFRYAHFDLGYLEQLRAVLKSEIRVVFWAE